MQPYLNFSQQIGQMALGDHVCLIYNNEAEQMEAILPYIKQGLANNEYCEYIVDEHSMISVKAALTKGGIDVEKEVARGALGFSTKHETYLKTGDFRPVEMVDFLRASMEKALVDGFTGYRITGEMTWTLGSHCGCHQLSKYESLLNEFFPGSKATAICQYNSDKFSPEVLRDVLRTHPVAILEGHVCNNLFYETPEIFFGKAPEKKRLEWMIAKLGSYHRTQKKLEAAINCRDEFLTIASHELRTPLTSLKLQAQGINRVIKKNGPLDEDFRARVEKAMSNTEKQVDRLAKLVDDLLDVSQINAGKLRIQPCEVDLGEMLHSVIDRYTDQARDKNVVFIANLQEKIVGNWDRFRLEQVFSNLITNSLKYGASPIEIKISQEEENAFVSVKDNGVGIKLRDQVRIFERYGRATHHNEVSGLGLGLYITRDIVEAHAGQIRVESYEGKGSTFSIELPLKHF